MFGQNIGIDLGTEKITAFVEGRGIVFSEDNALAYDIYNDETYAIGNAAGEMAEKTPDALTVKRPVIGGVISDFSVMTEILSHYIGKLCAGKVFRPNVIVSAPSCITNLERKTVIEAACAAGAGKVSIIDEPIVSALGAGLSIDYPHGTMVIDLGAGTTDIAIITMGTVAYAASVKTAGNTMDEAIQQYIKKEKSINIGLATAKRLKHTVGCAYKRSEEIEIEATGKNYVTGMPELFNVSSTEIYEALKDQINIIFDAIVGVMEQSPPELYSDICHEGILLTGGVAKLPGLDKELSSRLGIKVRRAADPEHCAAKGAGYILKNMDEMEDHGYSFRMKESISGI
ncbi:MAG: rod shape-determining protein [Ruminococcaceae bacterium]|nr:rod shape-determining protein [Oscillospiraceae bacterium]